MSESTEPLFLDSRNSNCSGDSNSEGERTPKQTPTPPPVIEETVVESVVRIVGTTNSNLTEESIHDNTTRHSGTESLQHTRSDGDIFRQSSTSVQPPKNIEYTRTLTAIADVIGNKDAKDRLQRNGLSHDDSAYYQKFMNMTHEEIEIELRKERSWKNRSINSLSGHSGSGSGHSAGGPMPVFGGRESSQESAHSEQSAYYEDYDDHEEYEPHGFDLTVLGGAYFSVGTTADEEDEIEDYPEGE